MRCSLRPSCSSGSEPAVWRFELHELAEKRRCGCPGKNRGERRTRRGRRRWRRDGGAGRRVGSSIRTRRLGVIPLGTFNNIARGAGVPIEPDEAVEVVVRGRAAAIDAGSAWHLPSGDGVGSAAANPADRRGDLLRGRGDRARRGGLRGGAGRRQAGLGRGGQGRVARLSTPKDAAVDRGRRQAVPDGLAGRDHLQRSIPWVRLRARPRRGSHRRAARRRHLRADGSLPGAPPLHAGGARTEGARAADPHPPRSSDRRRRSSGTRFPRTPTGARSASRPSPSWCVPARCACSCPRHRTSFQSSRGRGRRARSGRSCPPRSRRPG